MLLENPYSTNTSEYDRSLGLRWRQMKYVSLTFHISNELTYSLGMLVVRFTMSDMYLQRLNFSFFNP